MTRPWSTMSNKASLICLSLLLAVQFISCLGLSIAKRQSDDDDDDENGKLNFSYTTNYKNGGIALR